MTSCVFWRGDRGSMIIFLILKELFQWLVSIVYVGTITWLFPVIIIGVILSLFGVGFTSIIAAGAKTFGSLFTMASTNGIKMIPNLVKRIAKFWRTMRKTFSRAMPNWAATILAWLVLIII